MRKVIAIDFDGTLCLNKWPGIGEEKRGVVEMAKREREAGAAPILWTCRGGEQLAEAVAWCRARGLEFDAVNENLPERVALYGGDPRKISADEYWEDRAVAPILVEDLYWILEGTGRQVPVGILNEEGGDSRDA